MQQLRFVKAGGDRDHVVLETADGRERFVLPINDALRDAIRSDLPRLHTDAPEPPARLSPREIQTRVRAGESPESLAVDNDMGLDRVMRFAGPVLDERARITDEARRGRARRSTDDAQLVIFGEAVDARFGAHGIEPGKVSWDSHRREDGTWVVAARWVGGTAERLAQWAFQTSSRTVSPLDETATDLLSDRPIRAVIADLPDRTATATPVGAIGAIVPPLESGVVTFPAMPEAATGPLPALEAVFDQYARGSGRSPVVSSVSASAVAGGTAPARTPTPVRNESLPLGLTEPVESDTDATTFNRNHRTRLGHRPADADEDRLARTRIPSWDDIMLGVRRKGD